MAARLTIYTSLSPCLALLVPLASLVLLELSRRVCFGGLRKRQTTERPHKAAQTATPIKGR